MKKEGIQNKKKKFKLKDWNDYDLRQFMNVKILFVKATILNNDRLTKFFIR